MDEKGNEVQGLSREEMDELKTGFFREFVPSLRKARRSMGRDRNVFAVLGHQIKGTAPLFGYKRLSDEAFGLETSAKTEEWPVIRTAFRRVVSSLRNNR